MSGPARITCFLLTAALLAGVAAGWSGPMAANEAALLQLPTLLILGAAVVACHLGYIDIAGFASLAVFLGLHTVASYYGYNNVPYDAWAESLTGQSLSSRFAWQRNHFDRLVHFAYGLCLFVPARQILIRTLKVQVFAATILALQFVLATSAIYELIEWSVAIVASPELAESYNGQQGDPWDAQKDTALAAAGALVTCLVFVRPRRPID